MIHNNDSDHKLYRFSQVHKILVVSFHAPACLIKDQSVLAWLLVTSRSHIVAPWPLLDPRGQAVDSRWNCYWSGVLSPALQQQLLDPLVLKTSQPQITTATKITKYRVEGRVKAVEVFFFKLRLCVTKCTEWSELIWMRVWVNYWPNCKHWAN